MEGIKRDLQGQEQRLCSVPATLYHVFRHYQGRTRYDNALDVCLVTLWPSHAISLSKKIDGQGILQESCHRKGLITLNKMTTAIRPYPYFCF